MENQSAMHRNDILYRYSAIVIFHSFPFSMPHLIIAMLQKLSGCPYVAYFLFFMIADYPQVGQYASGLHFTDDSIRSVIFTSASRLKLPPEG
jgi:hypothetical protein